MRKSRKFEIITINKSDGEVSLTMTCTTRKDMDDQALRDLIAREIQKKDGAKLGYSYAWRILR